MTKFRSLLTGVVVGVAALGISSCTYDPYYSGSSYSSSVGYGSGHGYGGSNFSTSFFVSTGSPRWGYDPYAGAYYDYNRRCYYDPYLSGYYPVGYRPRYVYGSPHPHGWRRGRSYIAPPSRIRSYNLTNYRDRTSRYQGLGRDWSKNVRSAPPERDQRPVRFQDQRSQQERFTGSRDGRSRTDFSPVRDSEGRNGRRDFRTGGSNFERSGSRGNSDSAARQQLMERMNQSRQRGSSQGSRREMAPQIQSQPSPQPPSFQGGGRPQRGEFRGSGGASPSGEGRGRGRSVRGLGEG